MRPPARAANCPHPPAPRWIVSEPTLEQILAELDDGGLSTDEVFEALETIIREIIALRDELCEFAMASGMDHRTINARLDSLDGQVNACYESGSSCEAEFRKRLDALESQARPFQESGEFAAGRDIDWKMTADEWRARAERLQKRIDAMVETTQGQTLRASRMEAERDAAIARADEAERERDEARDLARRELSHADVTIGKLVAQRDAARDALRKIVEIDGSDPAVLHVGAMFVAHKIAQAALDGSGQQ